MWFHEFEVGDGLVTLHDAIVSKHVKRIFTDSTLPLCFWMHGKANIVGLFVNSKSFETHLNQLKSQISAKSKQSALKLIKEVLDPHPQPSTTNRHPGPVTACLCILGGRKQVAGSLDLKQSLCCCYKPPSGYP